MIKKGFVLLLLLTICTISYAQSGSYSENRTVGSFDAISVCCGIDVYITEGVSSTIKVESNDEEYLSRIKTEVKKGELKISFNNKDIFKRPNNLRLKVYVSAKNLTGIKGTSGSDIVSTTPLSAKDIKVSASSGSDIKLELNATNLECSASSGSDIKISGTASYALVKASSGSDINMKEMTVRTVEASATAGSDVSVTATDAINARANSGGDVTFRGNPATINKKKSTGGDVRQIK